jgi:hypothetical protein
VRIVVAGTSAHDDALWSVPRELQGMPPEPGAARAWDREGWSDARIADTSLTVTEKLVDSLPGAVRRGDLTSPLAVGLGGDAVHELEVRPGEPVTLVGPAGTERDDVAQVLSAAGAGDVHCVEAPIMMPPRARDGLVVAVAPTPRIAEDLCAGTSAGLVDATPRRGRVLWVESGVGSCAQLAVAG